MSLARATISGIVIGEPEKRFTSNNAAVTNFTIQVTPSMKNETPYTIRIICWRTLSDIAVEQIHKGDVVTVEGRLQINQYEGPGGAVKRTYEIDASNLYLGQLQALTGNGFSSSGQGPQAPTSSSQPSAAYKAPNASVPVGMAAASYGAPQQETFPQDELLTEDDIPF